MTTEPSADTMERARRIADACWLCTTEKAELASVIAQALHDTQEEARREQREKDARIAERDGSSHAATSAQQTAEWQRDASLQTRTADRIASAIRNQESSP